MTALVHLYSGQEFELPKFEVGEINTLKLQQGFKRNFYRNAKESLIKAKDWVNAVITVFGDFRLSKNEHFSA
jgi:hypothetical protein